jgi:glutamyl-tRNA reductase
MALSQYVKALNWITDRIDQFSSWLERKKKRDAVQSMEKNVADNNASGVDKRLSELKQKAKDKSDSS